MDIIFKVLNFLFIFAEVLLIFNILIIVHELGHFLAARWRGLVIEKFGIWFGKPLWSKTVNGVQYSLGSIPAGGFVALPQMAPMETIEGECETPREALPKISVLDKIIVAIAGPLFSLGLALVFAVIVYFVGRPTTEMETTRTIGWLAPDSPALEAGLRPGDKILEVDGKPVSRFGGMGDSITWRVIRSEGDTIPFKIERDGKTLVIESGYVRAERKRLARSSLRQVLIAPKSPTLIEKVEPGSPAAEAGLEAGDRITAVNGSPIYSPIALGATIQDDPEKAVDLTVERGDRMLSFTVTPKVMSMEGSEPRPLIGIVWDPGPITLVYPGPIEQVVSSMNTLFSMFGALFSPKSDVKAEHLSGPVGIMRLYYNMFTSPDGWRLALWFSVFFNVNLAVLNMLPIPVLDGGHIMLAIIEGIRRKPINVKVLEIVQGVCAMLIIGYMLYVTFYDVGDLAREYVPDQADEQVEK